MSYTKKLLIVLFCIKGAFSFWVISSYFSSAHQERERVLQEHTKFQTAAAQKAAIVSEDLWHRLHKAQGIAEWDALSKINLSEMAKEDQELFRTIVQGKLFEVLFWQAEMLMAHARGLLEQDQNSPTADNYLEQARRIYEKIEELIPELGEIAGNSMWNAQLHYLKGVYYFRSIVVFIQKIQEEQSKVKDAVAQSIASLDKTFQYAPKDRDTEVAIEVLQKKVKTMLSLTDVDKRKIELQLLPAKDKEVGSFETGSRGEGRH